MAARSFGLAAIVVAAALAGGASAEPASPSAPVRVIPAVSYATPIASASHSLLASIVVGDERENLQTIQYFWGGRQWCWYFDGWHGPGYYWCGYRWRRGFGWGGPAGWNHWGWHRGGPGGYRGGRAGFVGGHEGFGRGGGFEGGHGGGFEGARGGGHEAAHGGGHGGGGHEGHGPHG
jgi:hypothetical protein